MNGSDIAATVVVIVFSLIAFYMGYVFYRRYYGLELYAKFPTSDKHQTDRLSTSQQIITEEVNNPIINGNIDDVDIEIQTASRSSSSRFHQSKLDTINIENSNDRYERISAAPLPTETDVDDDDKNYEHVPTQGIVKSGYLYKKSTSLKKDWLRRWFFIKDGKLFYCHVDSDIAYMKDIQAVEVANLVISTVREVSSKEFQIISPGSRGSRKGGGLYELQAETEEDAAEWVLAIRSQIEGSLNNQLTDSTVESESSSNSLFAVPTAKILKELHDANPTCADCNSSENVTWASLNLCIMICIECSGIHRSLGVHISKVRSLNLDKWSAYNIELTISLGNKKSNMIWEGGLPDPSMKISPGSTKEDKIRYITDKYKNKLFIAPTLRTIDANNLILRAAGTGKVYNLMQAIAAGGDVNTTWVSGEIDTLKTPLHLAVEGDFILCVELLCSNNASVSFKDSDGKSPLDYANKRNNQKIVELLSYYVK